MGNAKHAYDAKSSNKSKGKRTMAKKHSSNTDSIIKKLSKCILILIIIAIIIGIGYLFHEHYFKNPSNTELVSSEELTSSNRNNIQNAEEYHEASDIVSISNTLKVKDAEFLKISSVTIDIEKDELSTFSADIKNTTNELYENIELRIFLLDENKEVITSLDYTLKTIKENSTIPVFATIRKNLNNCKYYSVSLKK